uniref:ATP synthase subunit a n=1 Tax=Lophiomus setigerus TaxID=292417 RepID=Q8HM74_LOPSE|nr:ATP synthase F0 subunit 6 [Lophiomus setigerus]UIP57062.1 ATP synthase F0 subunit 6 [Lophius litulon]BAC23286.1 ATPase subunit 6 [Lophiomus setigerus]
MTLSLFEQFEINSTFGVPVIILAFTLPWLLIATPSRKLLTNRLVSVQKRFIRWVVKELIRPMSLGGHKWALLLTSLLLFIMTLNIFGLLPHSFTPTTQLAMNLGLSVPLWMATVIVGFRKHRSAALAHFLPLGAPNALIPILVIIELISLIVRPLALAVRLTANITAGHLMMQIVATGAQVLIPLMPVTAFITLLTLILFFILEAAMALVQAYVFVLLLSLYLEESQ